MQQADWPEAGLECHQEGLVKLQSEVDGWRAGGLQSGFVCMAMQCFVRSCCS